MLASGRRRSDVHAIDFNRVEFRPDGAVVLHPSRAFLPKTRAAAEGAKAFSPIVLPSLESFVGPEEPDALLCPVRAVRVYIRRTAPFRRGRNKLFISFQRRRTTDITAQTLSIWFRSLVQHIYNSADIDALNLYKVSTHQARHVAMSLASSYNVSMETLIRAGMWVNSTSFTNYYLSDALVVVREAQRFRLGPLVTSQTVVQEVPK